MPVLRKKWISREDCREFSGSGWIFVFGDNEERRGKGGQAAEMRDEPNAIGIRTKRKPDFSEDAFWSDADFIKYRRMIDEDLRPIESAVKDGVVVVMPSAGVGSGLSNMSTKCPKLFRYLNKRINELERM
jgi:hypothetical protein